MFQFQGMYCTPPPLHTHTHTHSTLISLINFVSKFYFQVATGTVITATLLRERFLTKSAKKPMAELRQETEENSQFIREKGFNVVEIYECQWRRIKRSNPDIHHFLTSELHCPLDKQKTLNKGQIIQAAKEGSLFGCVECDIRVPDHFKEKFSEMCPVFKNVEISRDDIRKYMKNFREEHGIMNRPRRNLIGSFHGEQILLATPLLKWYLDHGLEVTKIYQVIEYTLVPCFKPFGKAVSDARRAGDVDPNKAITADTMKLVGFVLLHYPPPPPPHTHTTTTTTTTTTTAPNRVFCVTK